MKQTGVIEQARESIKSVSNVLDSFSTNKDIAEGTELMKTTLKAIRDLVDELKLVVISSKKTGILSNVEGVIKESSEMYRNIASSK
jgi:archaellum biogenesis ATPase FlaH